MVVERCDVVDRKLERRCKNKPYREGYFKQGKNSWWSYLCRKHFQEIKRGDKRMWAWSSLGYISRINKLK